MTDRTHPDSGVPFTYGNYVNYAEHVQALHARIAELEAELEAVGAGGVQALARWGATAPVSADVRAAAQALVDRWDTPAWKDAEHTGAFIQRLREALAAPPAPEVRVPLSIEEVEAILARWDYAIHGDRVRYIVRETERAHGITAKESTP